MKKRVAIAVIFLFFVLSRLVQAKVFYVDGPGDIKKVALTFDDGPGKATKKILKILKEKNVKATFFMLGVSVCINPDAAKSVVSDGHEVGNHTYGHVNFYAYKGEDKINKMEKELLQGRSAIKETTGCDPFLVRFPYGYARADVVKVIKKNDCCLINWSFGCDWTKATAEGLHYRYKKALKNGAIFLMHDRLENKKVLSFLGDFIDEIKEAGYEIVTISELLNLK